jgi:hypothetical protein
MTRADDIQDEIKETRDSIASPGSAMVKKLELLEERLRVSIEGVRRNFDLHYQAEQHPWALFGGSLVVGYILGNWVVGRSAPAESFSRAPSQGGNGARDHFKKEIATTVRGMAAGALTSTLWEMGKQALFGRGPQSEAILRGGRRGLKQWQSEEE